MKPAQKNQGVFHGKMDKGYEKERFESLSIKTSIAKKFRVFCKKNAKSQSMTLLEMIDFFEINELSPNDRLGATITGLKSIIKKRFNAVIAIIRDIEKNQTQPTTAMLQALFEETLREEDDEETIYFEAPTLISENEELEYYRKQYYKTQQETGELKQEVVDLIEKTTYVKTTFGKGYYRLEVSKEEFEALKEHLN
ncbi:BfmA/BtgA family mobilization protein [Seonamhaeicola sp.]|uniref:BfmA/BtgA family mobilization protein n=1 Tax=Seonamhaeicola sp. TaxID=1912245 RepID=UPI00260F9C88|nr:BfmA/BtgA family mobilization protein [Seonamhaeicola sp.]